MDLLQPGNSAGPIRNHRGRISFLPARRAPHPHRFARRSVHFTDDDSNADACVGHHWPGQHAVSFPPVPASAKLPRPPGTPVLGDVPEVSQVSPLELEWASSSGSTGYPAEPVVSGTPT